jgi:hypothetical protein
MTKQLIPENQVKVRSENTNNEYPNIYISYRAITSNSVDLVNTIIYENGCTALDLGVANIYNDVEHWDHFNKKMPNSIKAKSAGGDVVRVWLEGDKLMAESRVGHEHVIANEEGQIIGSTYASAWLRFAQESVKQNGGNVKEYIPINIYKEFFEGKLVYPIRAISVEIPFEHYRQENGYDLTRNVLHIRKFDLTRISFLLFSTPAQTESGIDSITIRKQQEIIMENITTTRCICDLKELRNGDYLKDSKDNKYWSVRTEGENLTITDIASGEVTTTTLEVLKTNEDLDLATTAEVIEIITNQAEDLEKSEATIDEIRSAIRACMECQTKSMTKVMADEKQKPKVEIGMAGKVSSKNKIRADEVIIDVPMATTPTDTADVSVEAMMNEISIIKAQIAELQSSFMSMQETLNAQATRSIEDDNTDEADVVTETEEVTTPAVEVEAETVDVVIEAETEVVAQTEEEIEETTIVRGTIRSYNFTGNKLAPQTSKGFRPLTIK